MGSVPQVPEFSIVIPVFNRERLVGRALRSCVDQQETAFEVIVVDDGSTDASVAVIESFLSPRVKLVRHAANRGLAAARNTGIDVASGEWIVLVDSDDELLPGALSRMSEIAREAGAEVERMGFNYRRDDGRVSPFPPLRDEVLDYTGHLRWLEDRVFFDFLSCTRRFTYDSVRWREWNRAGYLLYPLDFALRYRTLFSRETLGLVHSDADNRLSRQKRKSANAFQAAVELGEEMDLILSRHGEGLRQLAPSTFQRFQRVRASYHFLTGSVRAGVEQSIRCLRASPLSVEVWLILFLGLASRRLFARVRSWRPPPT
jgi:glycosyltransferase involved in cell wall biosynthesis